MNHLGSFLGVMAQSENAGPEIAPPQGDQKTGEYYGEHIATFALKLKA